MTTADVLARLGEAGVSAPPWWGEASDRALRDHPGGPIAHPLMERPPRGSLGYSRLRVATVAGLELATWHNGFGGRCRSARATPCPG